MDNLTRREIFEHVQRACDEVTKGYHEQTGNRRIKFRVLQLVNKENSKLENDTYSFQDLYSPYFLFALQLHQLLQNILYLFLHKIA